MTENIFVRSLEIGFGQLESKPTDPIRLFRVVAKKKSPLTRVV